MNIPRIQHLISILETVPPQNFDLGHWSADRDCGTVACVGGHAMLDPVFNEQGLKKRYNAPAFGHHEGVPACSIFFDLPRKWFQLCDDREHPIYGVPDAEVTPAIVVAKLKALLP